MLTKEKIYTYVFAIVSSLYETGHGSPESMIYIGIGMNLSVWNQIKGLLIASELITVSNYYVELTEKGQVAGKEWSEVVKSSKSS